MATTMPSAVPLRCSPTIWFTCQRHHREHQPHAPRCGPAPDERTCMGIMRMSVAETSMLNDNQYTLMSICLHQGSAGSAHGGAAAPALPPSSTFSSSAAAMSNCPNQTTSSHGAVHPLHVESPHTRFPATMGRSQNRPPKLNERRRFAERCAHQDAPNRPPGSQRAQNRWHLRCPLHFLERSARKTMRGLRVLPLAVCLLVLIGATPGTNPTGQFGCCDHQTCFLCNCAQQAKAQRRR